MVEAKLTELDPIMQSFCERTGFRLIKTPEDVLYPKRMMFWAAREDINMSMHLTPDLSFRELMNRGFYPEMPWSLEVIAVDSTKRIRMLTANIFRDVPYSRLVEVLPKELESGFSRLRQITREDIINKGMAVGSLRPSEEDYAKLNAVAAKFAELDSTLKRFCLQDGLEFLRHGESTLWRGIRLTEHYRRYIVLKVNTSVRELMKRGFDPEMSCSLEIHATSPEEPGRPTRIYRRSILQDVPYFRLKNVLEASLKEALTALRALTREEILTEGEEM